MVEFYRENKQIADKIAYLAILLAGTYVFVNYIFYFIAPFVIGFFVSLVLNPAVAFFQKKLKISRAVSAVFLIIIVILLAAVAGSKVFGRVVSEARNFTDNLPEQIYRAKLYIAGLRMRFDTFMTLIPEDFAVGFDELTATVVNYLTATMGNYAKNLSFGLFASVPGIMLNFFLSMISSFFFIKDKEIIRRALSAVMPKWFKSGATTVRRGMFNALSGYLRAQAIIMSVVAAICILGLTILNYPYALLVGLALSVIDALPLLGSSLIYWPWALASIVSGNYRYAFGLLIINGVVFLTRQMLEPKILGSQIGVHPLLTLISIYVGLKVFGIVGLILGPVLFVTAKLILESNADYIQGGAA